MAEKLPRHTITITSVFDAPLPKGDMELDTIIRETGYQRFVDDIRETGAEVNVTWEAETRWVYLPFTDPHYYPRRTTTMALQRGPVEGYMAPPPSSKSLTSGDSLVRPHRRRHRHLGELQRVAIFPPRLAAVWQVHRSWPSNTNRLNC